MWWNKMKFKVGDKVRLIEDPSYLGTVTEIVKGEFRFPYKVKINTATGLWSEYELELAGEKKEMRPVQELIDEVMDWFDFGRVAKVMDALDWKWTSAEYRGDGVPIEAEVRIRARELLKEVLKEDNSVISSDGFRASYKDGMLSLAFIVEEEGIRLAVNNE